MASCSSSSIVASPRATASSYDVFLSFRGEDTRHSFTDHLYDTLRRAGICTFRDNEEINRGEELKPEIERAIRESRASVVVLSQNYVTSTWCLDELLLILKQRRECNHFVLPVFYGVDPSDVRKQDNTFSMEVKAFSRWTDQNVNLWKKALKEVADLAGMVLSGSETDFIEKIVDTIVCTLDLKLLSTPPHLIGMDTRSEFISSWLENEQSGDNILAICGMGGSGETTLAQFIYNSNKQKFGSSSYLEEIGKHNKEPRGMLRLQKQLLTDILGRKNASISSVSEGTRKVEEALQTKRILIVLDDIDDHDQLCALLGTRAFHTQSKIIITTRLLDIQAWFGSISWKCHVHKLELLNNLESLELLSCHAFGFKIPMEGFTELTVQLTEYCGGNPLALKVLGSFLFVKTEDLQERSSMIETWSSLLNSLNLLKGDLDDRIQGILQKSFDSLPHANYRELFLHIAFFFVGDYEDYVVKILEHDLHAKAGIMTLINRCLLTVSPRKKLMMHQLLQEMAKNLVLKENKDPAKRSRVSQNDESYRLLMKGEGSETVEGLALIQDIDQGRGVEPSALKTASLANMDKLKLLKLQSVKLMGSYKHFPELRWLKWNGCHLKTIPSGLLGSSLVVLDMSYGNLKRFEPPMVLNLLKVLDLKECWELVSIRNLSRLPSLESLILNNCLSLTHVCETIRGLKHLALLDLTGCENLLKVSIIKKFIYQLQRLKALCFGGEIPQKSLIFLPESLKFLFLNDLNLIDKNDVPVDFSGRLELFNYMDLGYNPFEVLPNNINLKGLRVLELTFCDDLKSLLCLPSTLEKLYTYLCFKLEKITFESGRFRLMDFGYRGCNKLSEVQGLFKLVSVEKLDEADLGHMKWIKAYQDHEVDLVGDEITKDRIWHIQVLYEYGIMSTYLPGIIGVIMLPVEYMSLSPFLSFRVPSCHNNRNIIGLYVTSSYRSSSTDEDTWVLFTKISNTTKGLTWMYNPMVYCKPGAGKDVVWISYWPIGNVLDTGDEINVSIIVGNGLTVSGCGASLVYMDDGEFEPQSRQNYMNEEEVIGGDLSEFELTTGGYYLCRRDFFKSVTPDWLRMLVGDTIPRKELQGWRKSRQTRPVSASLMELEPFRSYNYEEETIEEDIAFWKDPLRIML